MNTPFSGTLTDRDLHRHIAHEFTVPADTSRIAIEFQYDPQQVDAYKNLLTLTVFDPNGCRGAWHHMVPVQSIAIGLVNSTPGFLSGPIVPGVWNVIIDVHMALPGEPIQYTIDISTSDDPPDTVDALPIAPGRTASRGAGWYRGNLHSHTIHSDGAWDIPDLLAWAESEKLDFIALTDHNTVSGLDQVMRLSSDQLLTMGGIELTTFYGHALALGIHDWLDWRVVPGEYAISDIQHAVEAQSGLFVIAHPKAPGGAICTGCAWEYADMMPGSAHIVEVWNSEWESDSNNPQALDLWYQWLNDGQHLIATAGTDIHRAPRTPLRYGYSVVYADDLTESALLAGIARGHVYLSDGKVQITFTAEVDNKPIGMMGDTVSVTPGLQISAQSRGTEATDRGRLIVNGQVQVEVPDGSGIVHHWTPTADWRWAVIEVRDAEGNMRALTNPIYF